MAPLGGWANTVSVIRMLLAFVAVGLLFVLKAEAYWGAFVLTIIVIWMDGLDGYLARKLNEASRVGSVIDILSDRVVEQVYWVSFAVLGWIPLWMPLLVIARGVWVDGFRSLAFEQGFTAFGSSSMMQSKLGVLLVSSRFSRWSYAALKAVAFSLMCLAFFPKGLEPTWLATWKPELLAFTMSCLVGALFFCIVRGLPVLLESRRFLTTEDTNR